MIPTQQRTQADDAQQLRYLADEIERSSRGDVSGGPLHPADAGDSHYSHDFPVSTRSSCPAGSRSPSDRQPPGGARAPQAWQLASAWPRPADPPSLSGAAACRRVVSGTSCSGGCTPGQGSATLLAMPARGSAPPSRSVHHRSLALRAQRLTSATGQIAQHSLVPSLL
jgi:hypothetical protein